MNEQLSAAVKAKHDEFKQETGSVEPQPGLALRTLLIKVRDIDPVFCRVSTVLSGDSAPQCRLVKLHYAASIQAFTATRIASERLM